MPSWQEAFQRRSHRVGRDAFDDFDTKEWPDIKAYVDDEIAPRSDLELVAKGWRTALYRVLPQPA